MTRTVFIIMQITATLALMSCSVPNELRTNKSAQNPYKTTIAK